MPRSIELQHLITIYQAALAAGFPVTHCAPTAPVRSATADELENMIRGLPIASGKQTVARDYVRRRIPITLAVLSIIEEKTPFSPEVRRTMNGHAPQFGQLIDAAGGAKSVLGEAVARLRIYPGGEILKRLRR